MIPLLALGPHIFEVLPLTLQKISERTQINWPANARFGSTSARQFTGLGEDTLTIEGLLFNEEFGGYEQYLALKLTARAGEPVDLVGWGGSGAYGLIIGAVCILEVGAAHEVIGADGIGRKIAFNVECGALGDEAGGGLFG